MFEADEAQWPLVVVRSTESGSASDNADAYVALWERWLARGCHFGVLVVAGEARGEAPPPELAIRMRAWQEAARDRIRSSCVGIAYVMPSLSVLAAHRPIVRRRSEISLGCTGDAFGSVNEAGHGLASACDSLTLATSRLMAASRGGHQAARPACRLRARARGAVHDTTFMRERGTRPAPQAPDAGPACACHGDWTVCGKRQNGTRRRGSQRSCTT